MPVEPNARPGEADRLATRNDGDGADTLAHWSLPYLGPFAQAACAFLFISAFYWIAIRTPSDPSHFIRGAISSVIAMLLLALMTWTPPGHLATKWIQPAGFGLIFLLALATLVGSISEYDTAAHTFFVILLIFLGFLLVSRLWYLAGLLCTYACWEIVVMLHPEAGPWGERRLTLMAAALTGWALHVGQVRMIRTLSRLRTADGEQRKKLAEALGLAQAELIERRRVEESVKLSEKRLRDIADRIPANLWIADTDGSCYFINRHWIEYTGLSREESLGLGWRRAIHPDDLPRSRLALHEALEQRKPYQVELRYRRHDGVYRWYLVRAFPVRDEHDKVTRWLGISSDIDDQKLGTNDLAITRRLFEQIAESSPTIIYVYDRIERKNIYVSPSIVSILGYTQEQIALMGSNVLGRLIDPEDQASLIPDSEYDELGDGEVTIQECRCVHADGSRRILHFREVVLSRLPDRRACQVLGHGQDVTEQRRAEDSLRIASRRKEEFLAILAHELRNPLAAIVNAAEIMATRELVQQHEWALQIIDRQARQLGRLADDLLDVARIGRGLIEIVREQVDLVQVARDSVDAMRPQAEEIGHTISLDVLHSPLMIDGDFARLQQIVVNLLANAIKFTDQHGRIIVTLDVEGSFASLEVSDNGMGISAKDLPRLFDLFAQASLPRGRASDGLGLGLTLVKSLTELHGGTVSVSSDGPGRGSQFRLRFPLIEPPLCDRLLPALPSPEAARRILLIDDNSGMAQAMAELLRHNGHEIRVAPDGLSAVILASEFQPHFILLDIELPDIDGYEVARRLRKIPSCQSTPIAVMSGHARDLDRERSRSAGFVEHLIKPVRLSTLRELIRRVSSMAPGAVTAETPPHG
jgi:PAS domain S-box-containing protein